MPVTQGQAEREMWRMHRREHGCAAQDKAAENGTRAVDMLESMFEWLLQPAQPGEECLPASPTSSHADAQPTDSIQVRALRVYGWAAL